MGTGITTGPYTITSGQTLSLNDPATWSIASATVQLQNNTGYTIFVQSAGAGYNIQPFTVSTIPCAGGQTLVAVVSSTANVQVGLLTAVWLLPDQTGPMPDGPMTIFPKNRTAAQITTATNPDTAPPNFIQYISGLPGIDTNITITYTNAANWTTYQYAWLYTYSAGYLGSAFVSSATSGTLYYTGLNLTSSVGQNIMLIYGTTTTPVSYATAHVGIPISPGPQMFVTSAIGSD